jgi:hypothetical protein
MKDFELREIPHQLSQNLRETRPEDYLKIARDVRGLRAGQLGNLLRGGAFRWHRGMVEGESHVRSVSNHNRDDSRVACAPLFAIPNMIILNLSVSLLVCVPLLLQAWLLDPLISQPES